MNRHAASLAVLAIALSSVPLRAQETPVAVGVIAAGGAVDGATGSEAPPIDINGDGVDEAGEILVVATRLRGQVDTAQPPIVTLDEEQIASYGAGSIQDLLAALAPQTGSGRGRGDGAPVILLNGMRISGFRELRGLPPEAIRRVEVLPEEVALKYGYRPDQRVVNFILKDNFRSIGSESEVGLPTQGGFTDLKQEVTLAKIDGASRLNMTGTLKSTGALTEAERGIVQAAPVGIRPAGDPDPADFRTLQARARSAALNTTWAKGLGGGASLSLNGLVQRDDSRSLNGLNTVTLMQGGTAYDRTLLGPSPLVTHSQVTTVQGGAALNKPLGAWSLAVTGDGGHVETESTIDNRANLSGVQALVDAGLLSASEAIPANAYAVVGPDWALSKVDTLTSLATLSGRPLRLPGGEVALTVKAGFAYSGITSRNTRSGNGTTQLRRGDLQAGFSLDVPITSRKEGFGAGVGDLSLNANGEVHRLSDFGTLYDYGAGMTWKPTGALTVQASFIGTDAAPGLSSLGGPLVVNPAVALYDFTRGETVLASVTTGGNAALLKERQRDIKLGLNWDLPFMKNSTFIAEFFRNKSSNTTNAFPLLTPEVEAAFPGRVVRDASGRIISVDQRPVTFASEKGTRLRIGLNLSGSFGKPDPSAARGRVGGGAGAGAVGSAGGRSGMGAGGPFPGGGAGGGRGFGRMGGPGGPGSDGLGRWNLSLTHTIRFTQKVQITPGGTELNLLDGDALTGGGVARHALQLEGGGFYRGFGLRLMGTYTGGTHVDASGLPGSTRLDFAPIATFNLRVFADLGRKPKLVSAVPFLKGARVSLDVDNLFDAQQRVTDGNGATPLRYRPGYLDPRGRVISVEFRKQF